MSEYVVKWKHLRWPKFADEFYADWANRRISTQLADWLYSQLSEPEPSRNLRNIGYDGDESGNTVAQHGGKTECRIYDADDINFVYEIATGTAICSWRDQFDRRVGRLYSLALALCELDLDLPTRRQLLLQNGAHAWEWSGKFVKLDAEIEAKDKPAVKRICAEIVASWKRR